MIDQEDEDYVCTLTPASLEKAVSELHEDPTQRLGAVQTLRQWICEQKHFTFRTDTDFLLQVLRTAKFSQLRAREIIETFVDLRAQRPDYFTNIDTHEPGLIAFIDKQVSLVLPKRDKEGRIVWIYRPGMMNLKDSRFSEVNELRSSMALNTLVKDCHEDVLVHGELMVCDLTGITAKHVARMTVESDRNATKVYIDCMLGRFKGCYIYNGGPALDVLFNFVKPFLKKKLLDRMHVCNTMESMYKAIPMELWPDEYLPDDYTGPSAGPMSTIAENVKKGLQSPEFRARLLDLTSDRYRLHNDVEKPKGLPRPESFRKLAVD